MRNRFCLVTDCSLVQNNCHYLKPVPHTWRLVVPSVVPSAKAAHLGLESRCPKHTTQAVSFVGPTNARHTCNNQGRTEVELQWAGGGALGGHPITLPRTPAARHCWSNKKYSSIARIAHARNRSGPWRKIPPREIDAVLPVGSGTAARHVDATSYMTPQHHDQSAFLDQCIYLRSDEHHV